MMPDFFEAEGRLEELHSGKIEGIDSDEAFRSARKVLHAEGVR